MASSPFPFSPSPVAPPTFHISPLRSSSSLPLPRKLLLFRAFSSPDASSQPVSVLEDSPPISSPTNGSSQPTGPKRTSGLQKGGTLSGDRAFGLDPSPAALGKSSLRVSSSGPFSDARWKNGTWDLKQFTRDGKVDWDSVIDAEVIRRKWLEENPESSNNEDPVVFDTSIIPWWAWVKRFHLPEAELLNGRAAMIGYVMGYFVDALTGAGLVDQTSNFFGKLLLLISVLGVLVIRKNEDLDNLKQFAKEWTFYDNQWQAAWQDEKATGSD